MSTQFPNPPTYTDPYIKPPGSDVPKFNPIWAKWFIDLVQWINANGGGGGVIQHNSLAGLQGGTTAEYYHLTNARYSTLTGVQNAQKVFAGPASGADAAAAFRYLTALYLAPGVYPPGADGQDGEDSWVPGPQGVSGPPGVTLPGFPLDGQDGEDSMYGPPGNQGPQGLTGSQGSIGPVITVEDGKDGEDGMIRVGTGDPLNVPILTGGAVFNAQTISAGTTLTIPTGYGMVSVGPVIVNGDVIGNGDWVIL